MALGNSVVFTCSALAVTFGFRLLPSYSGSKFGPNSEAMVRCQVAASCSIGYGGRTCSALSPVTNVGSEKNTKKPMSNACRLLFWLDRQSRSSRSFSNRNAGRKKGAHRIVGQLRAQAAGKCGRSHTITACYHTSDSVTRVAREQAALDPACQLSTSEGLV